MPKIVKYGIIGAGAISQRRHIPEIHANEQSVVAAVVDPVKDRAHSVAECYGAQAFTSHKKMLEQADLDAVVVAGPNALHAPQSIDAFKAGLHVLVEKPMATTKQEAKAMIAASKKAKKYLMIGMNQRLMPPHVKAREVLDQGKLGKILAFETNFKHSGADHWSVDGAASWFFKKNLAVLGVNGDLGIHKADLMRFLLGEEFTHVGGFIATLDKKYPNGKLIAVDDNAYLTLKTDAGTIGSIHISWTNYAGIEDNGTVLHCTNGVMRIGMDPEYGVMVDYADGSKDRYAVGEVATNDKQVSSGVSDAFTECIINRRKPAIDGDEGYRALQVILTAVEAAKEGATKKIRY
ncbi:Gfo/Idh/MocA family protein [Algisphaera agarilytica]|uniref:Putative dehydrogenase n=1 Tax=Algisphaera agarilytica TaxID=1385975 RepID=A0A7X0H5Z6_9BACT|nr:Gfo/Idh/MocA family oxidoreductase [Algisphaera agarilytica]MBB6428425.1 putative dehydrogenase [Algisphaera agarilytica]